MDSKVVYSLNKMTKSKKPSPSKLRRSLNRLKCFNNMVMKAVVLNKYYPGLDIRPIKNYFGGSSYDVVWFHDYPEIHIAVLEEDIQPDKLIRPDQTLSFFQNLQKFKDMLESIECSDIYWKSLMRDVVRHNLDKKVWCEDACSNFPICSTMYNVMNPWSGDNG